MPAPRTVTATFNVISDDDAKVTYEPWTDGHAVGFKATNAEGEVRYIYLNPSGGSGDGVANVFLYIGKTGDLEDAGYATFYDLFTGENPEDKHSSSGPTDAREG